MSWDRADAAARLQAALTPEPIRKNRLVDSHPDVLEPGRGQGRRHLLRGPMDLDDPELAAVRETSERGAVGGDRIVVHGT